MHASGLKYNNIMGRQGSKPDDLLYRSKSGDLPAKVFAVCELNKNEIYQKNLS